MSKFPTSPEKIRKVKILMAFQEKIERNEKIFQLIDAGYTYMEVARLYRISHVRVLQIYNSQFRKKFSYLNLKNKEEKNHGKNEHFRQGKNS